MAKIKCIVEQTSAENGYGKETSAMSVRCSRCGHETESFGTSEGSIKRCLMLLSEECPRGEKNFYIES